MFRIIWQRENHKKKQALMSCETGIKVIVPRSGYMCTSVGIHVYLGRGTCVPRSGYDDLKGIFQRQDRNISATPHAPYCFF